MNDPFENDDPTRPHDPPAGEYAASDPSSAAWDTDPQGPSICPACRCDRSGVAPAAPCPVCGAYPQQAYAPQYAAQHYAAPTNGLAIAAMILGIASIPACLFYGILSVIMGGLGLVFVHISRKQMRAAHFSESSKTFALTGFICSLIGLVLGLIYMLAIIIFIIVMVNSAPPPGSSPPSRYPGSNPAYPQQWNGSPSGGSVNVGGNRYQHNVAPGELIIGPRGMDAHGRVNLPHGVEYGPNGQVRPSLPGSLEYGPGGRVQPVTPGFPSQGPPSHGSPHSPSPF